MSDQAIDLDIERDPDGDVVGKRQTQRCGQRQRRAGLGDRQPLDRRDGDVGRRTTQHGEQHVGSRLEIGVRQRGIDVGDEDPKRRKDIRRQQTEDDETGARCSAGLSACATPSCPSRAGTDTARPGMPMTKNLSSSATTFCPCSPLMRPMRMPPIRSTSPGLRKTSCSSSREKMDIPCGSRRRGLGVELPVRRSSFSIESSSSSSMPRVLAVQALAVRRARGGAGPDPDLHRRV